MSKVPFGRPGKVIAVGRNYRQNASKADVDDLPLPLTFAKFPACFTGPEEPVRLPSGLVTVDYEAEPAVGIGQEASNVIAFRSHGMTASPLNLKSGDQIENEVEGFGVLSNLEVSVCA